ncbi:MAG: hypothetical protein M3340_07240 [Actinomycetota bacterium]|nr:hypothetical protein [Actinomycetota bacterium]
MHEELVAALQEHERRPRGSLDSDRMVRWIALLWVPVAAAVLAGFVHQEAGELVWPPSPVLLLAPLASYYVIGRVSSSRIEVVVTAVVSAFVAVLASWGVAFVIGAVGAVMGCAGPEGGCLPGW